MPDRMTTSYGTSTGPRALYVLHALRTPGGKPFAAITYPLFYAL